MFSIESIQKNYADFFKTYPIDISKSKLKSMLEKSWKNKETVRKLFPLDSEGRVLIAEYEQGETGESIDMSFEKTINAIYVIAEYCRLDAVSRSRIHTNTYPTKSGPTKLSRVIAAAILAKPLDVIMQANLAEMDLCTELPLLPLTGKGDAALIVQNFYSEVAKMKSAKLRMELSFNPFDILNASTGRVSSCNKIGGQYESAPLAAAMSPRMAILRVLMPSGVLMGRQYVCIGADGLSATFQPLYGQMSTTHCQDFRTWMSAYFKYRRPPAADVTWRVCFERITMPTDVMSAVRTSTFYVDSTYATFWRSDTPNLPELVVGETFCLACGKGNRNTLICDVCSRTLFKRCSYCGKLMGKSDNEMCDHCLNTITQCKLCGRKYRKDDNDTGICHECNPRSAYCVVCGVYDNMSNFVPVIGESVYAHADCLKHKSKCACGVYKNKHSTHCLLCSVKLSFISSVSYSFEKIGNVFRMLKQYGKTETEPKVVPTRIKFGWSEDKAA